MHSYFGQSDPGGTIAAKRDAQIDEAISKLTDPSQVAGLPWGGNFMVDQYLFYKVREYAKGLIDDGDLAGAQLAMILSSEYGMGMKVPTMPDAEFVAIMEDNEI